MLILIYNVSYFSLACVMSRDGNVGIGPRAWSAKACSGVGLGLVFVGPQQDGLLWNRRVGPRRVLLDVPRDPE